MFAADSPRTQQSDFLGTKLCNHKSHTFRPLPHDRSLAETTSTELFRKKERKKEKIKKTGHGGWKSKLCFERKQTQFWVRTHVIPRQSPQRRPRTGDTNKRRAKDHPCSLSRILHHLPDLLFRVCVVCLCERNIFRKKERKKKKRGVLL